MFFITLFGHRGQFLRNKAFLGTVIDMAQMSFLRFLANQNRCLISLLRQWLKAIWSAEHVNFPLNSTKRKQATWKLCILICRDFDLELGPWLVNNIIDDPCISDPAPWIDFTPCLSSSWDHFPFLKTKTIFIKRLLSYPEKGEWILKAVRSLRWHQKRHLPYMECRMAPFNLKMLAKFGLC